MKTFELSISKSFWMGQLGFLNKPFGGFTPRPPIFRAKEVPNQSLRMLAITSRPQWRRK